TRAEHSKRGLSTETWAVLLFVSVSCPPFRRLRAAHRRGARDRLTARRHPARPLGAAEVPVRDVQSGHAYEQQLSPRFGVLATFRCPATVPMSGPLRWAPIWAAE